MTLSRRRKLLLAGILVASFPRSRFAFKNHSSAASCLWRLPSSCSDSSSKTAKSYAAHRSTLKSPIVKQKLARTRS